MSTVPKRKRALPQDTPVPGNGSTLQKHEQESSLVLADISLPRSVSSYFYTFPLTFAWYFKENLSPVRSFKLNIVSKVPPPYYSITRRPFGRVSGWPLTGVIT